MANDFDPNKYLEETKTTETFDPNAYLGADDSQKKSRNVTINGANVVTSKGGEPQLEPSTESGAKGNEGVTFSSPSVEAAYNRMVQRGIEGTMSKPITLGQETMQQGVAKSDMGMPSREEQLVKADVVTNQNEYKTIEKNLSGKVKTQREKEKELQNKLKVSQYIQKLIGDSGNVVEGEGAPMVEEDIDLDIYEPIKFEIDELQPERVSENANPELRDRVILKNSKEARQKTYDFENVIEPNISLVKKRSDAKALLQKTNEDINKLSEDLIITNDEIEGDITEARKKNKLAMVELGIPDSFALGVTESIKAIDLSKAMASGDDDKVGAILEDAYIQNRLYGDRKTSQISQMLGGQAVPLGVSFATAIVSGGNPLLTAGVTSGVYGGMGAGMSATQAYIELRNQGKSQAEALDVAKNMAIVGGAGGVVEGVIGTTLQAGKIASKVLGLNKGFAKTLVTAMAEAGVDGITAMGVQASDNLFAIANGIDRKVSDGVLEQGAMEVAFGAGYQVLFKGASKLTPKTYKKLVNEYAKFPTVIHQQVIDKAVKDGVISASDAKPILDDIVASSKAQEKLKGVEIDEDVEDDVIDIQKKIDELEASKKDASPAVIGEIDRQINELSTKLKVEAGFPLTPDERKELNLLQTARDSNKEYDKAKLAELEQRQKNNQDGKTKIVTDQPIRVKYKDGRTGLVFVNAEGDVEFVPDGNSAGLVIDKQAGASFRSLANLGFEQVVGETIAEPNSQLLSGDISLGTSVLYKGGKYQIASSKNAPDGVKLDTDGKVRVVYLKGEDGKVIAVGADSVDGKRIIDDANRVIGKGEATPTETAPVQKETKVVEAQQPSQETVVEPSKQAGSVVGGEVKQQELDAQRVNKEAGVDIYVARQEVDANGTKYTLSQINENGNTNTFVIEDTNGNEIGKAQLSADGNFLENIRIDEKHRRRGLASKVYDFIELRKGIELEPSPNKQSKEAKALWDNRNLKKVTEQSLKETPVAEAETLKPNDKAVIQGVDVNIPDAKTQEILKEERNEKPYFDKEVEKLDNSTLSEEEVNALLDRDDVAILTGTNPDNNAVDDATNVRLNQEAEKWLKEKGYKYHPTAGKYNQAENSFIVEGITVADAIEFAKVFKQESVAHSEGLVYKNGEINPRVRKGDRSNVDTSNPDENFVSAVKTKDGKVVGFQFGIDFDTTNKYEKPKEAPQAEQKTKSDAIADEALELLGITPKEVKFSKTTGEPQVLKTTEQKEADVIEQMNSMNLVNEGVDLDTPSTTKEKIEISELNSRLDNPLNAVKWDDFEGMPFTFTISDQLRTGDIKNPNTNEVVTDLKGGIGFNGTKGNENNAWANTTKEEAEAMLQRAKDVYENNKPLFEKLWKEGKLPDGHIPMAVVKMAEASILSNEAVFRVGIQNIETLPKANRKKAVVELAKSMKAKIATESASLKRGVDKNGKPYTENTIKLKKKGISQYQKILDIITKNNYSDIVDVLKDKDNFSLPEKTLIANEVFYGSPTPIGGKEIDISRSRPSTPVSKALIGDKNPALINLGKITDLLTEPSMKNVPNMHIISVVGVDVKAKNVNKINHTNYSYGVKGKSIGVLESPVHMKDAFGEAYGSALSQVVKNEADNASVSIKNALTQGIPVQAGLPNRVFKSAIAKRQLDAVDKLSGFLRQAFPNTTFFTSQEAWDAAMEDTSIKKKLKDGEVVYAFTTDGNVFINPNLKTTKATLHETGHIWMGFVKENNPEIHKKGLSLVDGTKEHQKAKEQYGDTELAREEALMELMSSKGDTIVNAAQKAKFKEWLLSVYKYVADNFKSLLNLSSKQVENLTLDEFLNGMLSDILSGKELTIKKVKTEGVKFSAESKIDKLKQFVANKRKDGLSDADIKEGLDKIKDKAGLTDADISEVMKSEKTTPSGAKTGLEEKSIFETHDETKGASKKDKVLSEYEKENPEKAQRVREIIDNFEDMKTMLQTKIDNGEITNLKIEC